MPTGVAATVGSAGAKEARLSLRPVAASMTAYCCAEGTQRASLNGLPLKTELGGGAAGDGEYGSENMCQPAESTFGRTVKLSEVVRGRPVSAPAAVTATLCEPAASATRAVTRVEPETDCTEAVVALPSTLTLTPLEEAFTSRPRMEVAVVSTG